MPSNINVSYTSLKSIGLHLLGYHSLLQYGSISIRLAIVASHICEIIRESENIRTYTSSVSCKIIDLGANQKRIRNFLSAISSNFAFF